MNSCILMAQIIQDPELRYTSDNQTPIAQMLVEFPGIKAEDPPTTLKVVGWRELAHDIKENYAVGDRIVIEGRLGMNTIERSEGFKEKRAELTASRIYKLGADTELEPQVSTSSTALPTPAPTSTPKSNNVVVPMRARSSPAPASVPSSTGRDYLSSVDEPTFEPPATVPTSTSVTSESEKDLDDIPF
ncbi:MULTISPECIES: single-stranded DNA-binding protein [unclassified Coleofasciculus]|uniref:single-stranded DNA-binding protein n=1 Tax=unclassified Coleofasciculus TaxID=2692782 RepID=UPI00187E8A8F|nr:MULTISPECIES: single-stranded DNA-binding protein [unclassified Coleofasciculus]MBE9125049.1 single-stranded DNA-binding protein [Coleofasciculus sp. LEGE 07081]MBE9147631.1 single-stranded DNA-binding protein [Coleofasciculus sp. LEGE 07092]